MPYNYSVLLGKIIEVYGTQGAFARAMGLSEHSVSRKLNNKIQWTQSEMLKSCTLLNISRSEIPKYFFAV
ncbi:MAG: DUF739 family protein [Ruminococcaceae bacterium]|nr:DUF739 family protein [Oscillospiraceae bacterium]